MNTLILCNGQPPSRALLSESRSWADYFIAADGGANTARSLGILPDVVVGDLDSYSAEAEDLFEVIKDPDQYSTDLQKALGLAVQKEASQVVVLGALGQRIDHTLTNLSVLKEFNSRFSSFVFKDEYGTLKLIASPFSADLIIGTTVSLFPLSGKVSGITTEGLKYPLHDEALEVGIKNGSSNKVVSNPVSISFEKGDLILFVGKNI